MIVFHVEMMVLHIEMMVFHIGMMAFHRTLRKVTVQAADGVQLPEAPVCWAVQAADLTQLPEPGTGVMTTMAIVQ